jgi:hypothetical protein
MQQAYAQARFERSKCLACCLRANTLGRCRAPDATKLDGFRESLDSAKIADGHKPFL